MPENADFSPYVHVLDSAEGLGEAGAFALVLMFHILQTIIGCIKADTSFFPGKSFDNCARARDGLLLVL